MKHKRLSTILCSVILLVLSAYAITSFSRNAASSAATVTPSKSTAASFDASQIVWPGVGQAAVGSVEDGFLASSSTSEHVRPTASMAKVIVALAVMKKQPLKPGQDGRTYIVTADDVANYRAWVARGGSVVPVYAGMTLTQYEAIEAMLLPSGNNIADMLVDRVFGSTGAYISYAQDMLHSMGLSNTVVADASGFSPSTVSTPSELVAIGIAALKNPVIAEVVAKPQAVLQGAGIIRNTNELLGNDGVIGIKTGTTDAAGSCLLFAARFIDKAGKEKTIVGVIMGDTDAASLYSDSRELLVSAKQGYGQNAGQGTDSMTTRQRSLSPPM